MRCVDNALVALVPRSNNITSRGAGKWTPDDAGFRGRADRPSRSVHLVATLREMTCFLDLGAGRRDATRIVSSSTRTHFAKRVAAIRRPG